jgi:hypothetical protein
MKTFSKIEYKGGHSKMPKPCTVEIDINPEMKFVKLRETGWLGNAASVVIYVSEIINISLDEKSKRSLGKTAAGAIIGGVLTGGIGLVAGGLFGARSKNTSLLYLTIAPNGKEVNIILKAGKQADGLYAEIAALL